MKRSTAIRKQKFLRGDVVFIKDLSGCLPMAHFESNQKAVIIGSYADQYDGTDYKEFTVRLWSTGSLIAWYPQGCLKLIRRGTEKDVRRLMMKEAKRSET